MNAIEIISDLDAVRALLAATDLPTSDVGAEQTFFGVYSGPTPIAVVGLELLGADALLRSLAVADSHRNQGLAQALVRHAETYASAQGVESLYLLTTTAQLFFERLGFFTSPRASAPPAIAATAQFSGLCPASSAFLTKSVARLTSYSTGPLQAVLAPTSEFKR